MACSDGKGATPGPVGESAGLAKMMCTDAKGLASTMGDVMRVEIDGIVFIQNIVVPEPAG